MEKPLHIVQRSLPSNRKSVRVVEKFLNYFREKFKLYDEIYYKLLIALTEAVNNAVIHGNKLNENKRITLSIEVFEHEVIGTVTDEEKDLIL